MRRDTLVVTCTLALALGTALLAGGVVARTTAEGMGTESTPSDGNGTMDRGSMDDEQPVYGRRFDA